MDRRYDIDVNMNAPDDAALRDVHSIASKYLDWMAERDAALHDYDLTIQALIAKLCVEDPQPIVDFIHAAAYTLYIAAKAEGIDDDDHARRHLDAIAEAARSIADKLRDGP